MQYKIFPAARRRLIEIWHYTDKTWGEKQADKYIRGLYRAIEKAGSNKHLWRKVEHEEITGIYFLRYGHHYVFFRELSKGVLGVVNVLHENMDIPSRLKDDLNSIM
jgi:plasmid stabilization system protein ParE